MTHAHVPGWPQCPLCGIRAPMNCPTCRKVHERIHHYKRPMRRADKLAKGRKP